MLIPKNEIELIILFAQIAQEHGFEILSAQSSGFPDAIILKDDVKYRVEFEYKSSNFWLHKHNPADCDFVVCWINDDDCPVFPIVTLSSDNWWNIELPLEETKTTRYWKKRALKAEAAEVENISPVDLEIRKVFEQMRENNEGISYNKIARQIFGCIGGNQTHKIRSVLGDL